MNIRCHRFLVNGQPQAQLEIADPISLDSLAGFDADQVKSEVVALVRAGLANATMPDDLAQKKNTWEKLLADLEQRADAIRDEMTALYDRQNEGWKTGSLTAAELEAGDEKECELRELLAKNLGHQEDAQRKLAQVGDELAGVLRLQASKIAQAQGEFSPEESKAFEGLKAFLEKNQVQLIGVCKKLFTAHWFRPGGDSMLAGVANLGDSRARELLAAADVGDAGATHSSTPVNDEDGQLVIAE